MWDIIINAAGKAANFFIISATLTALLSFFLWDGEALALTPELVPQPGILGQATAVVFSHDGALMACVSGKDILGLWDVRTGLEINSFNVKSSLSNAVAFSADDRMLMTLDGSGPSYSLCYWDITAGSLVKSINVLEGEGLDPRSFVFFQLSPDGRYLAAMRGVDLWVWDCSKGKETFRSKGAWYSSVTFSGDSTTFAFGDTAGNVEVIDLGTGKKLRSFTAQTQISSLGMNGNGKLLVRGGNDGSVRFYNIADCADGDAGREVLKFKGDGLTQPVVVSAVLSSDGRRISALSDNGMVVLFDVVSGRVMKSPGQTKLEVELDTCIQDRSLSFSPDGRLLARGGSDLSIWDVEQSCEVYSISKRAQFSGDNIVFSAQPGLLASYGDPTSLSLAEKWAPVIRVWNLSLGKELSSSLLGWKKQYLKKILESAANGFSLSPDGNSLLLNGEYKAKCCTRYDLTTGAQEIYRFQPKDGRLVISSGFDDDRDAQTGRVVPDFSDFDAKTGKIVNNETIISTYNKRGEIILGGFRHIGKDNFEFWNGTTGKEIGAIYIDPDDAKNGMGKLPGLIFSPDGEKFAAYSKKDGKVKIWDVAKCREVIVIEIGHPINGILFTADGREIAVITGNEVRFYDSHGGGKGLITVNGGIWQNLSNICAASFSPASDLFAVGCPDNSVKVYDLDGKKLKFNFAGHRRSVTSVAFSPDGKVLASGSWDCSIKFWDLADGNEMATLIPVGEDDYIIITPDGYYTSSKGGMKGAGFKIGKRVYPPEQFDLKFNRPDIVFKRLGFAPQGMLDQYYAAYMKRLARMKIQEKDLGGGLQLPEIEVEENSVPVTTNKREFLLKVKARDSMYSLDRINLYINGVPVYGSAGISVVGEKTSEVEREVPVELTPGRNKVQLSVLNVKGVESLRRTFEVFCDSLPAKPDLYVVAVGVSKYKDSSQNLGYASKDASDLAAMFDGLKGRFGNVHIMPLLDDDATKEKILASKALLMKSRPDDEVVIFLSGHGMVDEKMEYYFATTDIDFDNPSARGMPYESIERLLDGIPARKKLLLMDTCQSGEVDTDVAEDPALQVQPQTASVGQDEVEFVVFNKTSDGLVKTRNPRKRPPQKGLGLSRSFELSKELFSDLRLGTGANVISASKGDEVAIEGEDWGNGVFTYTLKKGIDKGEADANHDGSISVSELRDYVVEKVSELTKGRQTPTARSENIDFDFAVF